MEEPCETTNKNLVIKSISLTTKCELEMKAILSQIIAIHQKVENTLENSQKTFGILFNWAQIYINHYKDKKHRYDIININIAYQYALYFDVKIKNKHATIKTLTVKALEIYNQVKNNTEATITPLLTRYLVNAMQLMWASHLMCITVNGNIKTSTKHLQALQSLQSLEQIGVMAPTGNAATLTNTKEGSKRKNSTAASTGASTGASAACTKRFRKNDSDATSKPTLSLFTASTILAHLSSANRISA